MNPHIHTTPNASAVRSSVQSVANSVHHPHASAVRSSVQSVVNSVHHPHASAACERIQSVVNSVHQLLHLPTIVGPGESSPHTPPPRRLYKSIVKCVDWVQSPLTSVYSHHRPPSPTSLCCSFASTVASAPTTPERLIPIIDRASYSQRSPDFPVEYPSTIWCPSESPLSPSYRPILPKSMASAFHAASPPSSLWSFDDSNLTSVSRRLFVNPQLAKLAPCSPKPSPPKPVPSPPKPVPSPPKPVIVTSPTKPVPSFPPTTQRPYRAPSAMEAWVKSKRNSPSPVPKPASRVVTLKVPPPSTRTNHLSSEQIHERLRHHGRRALSYVLAPSSPAIRDVLPPPPAAAPIHPPVQPPVHAPVHASRVVTLKVPPSRPRTTPLTIEEVNEKLRRRGLHSFVNLAPPHVIASRMNPPPVSPIAPIVTAPIVPIEPIVTAPIVPIEPIVDSVALPTSPPTPIIASCEPPTPVVPASIAPSCSPPKPAPTSSISPKLASCDAPSRPLYSFYRRSHLWPKRVRFAPITPASSRSRRVLNTATSGSGSGLVSSSLDSSRTHSFTPEDPVTHSGTSAPSPHSSLLGWTKLAVGTATVLGALAWALW